ncbi:MAG TPA: hypothetical protein VFQ96_06385 [Microbacteriaceae bacterium]|nr:hypothetical protein [Microbacteriaceae bacterium]
MVRAESDGGVARRRRAGEIRGDRTRAVAGENVMGLPEPSTRTGADRLATLQQLYLDSIRERAQLRDFIARQRDEIARLRAGGPAGDAHPGVSESR